MKFEVGKYYQNASGKTTAIVGRAETTGHGKCLVGEDPQGNLRPVSESEHATVGYVEISRAEWEKKWPSFGGESDCASDGAPA